MSFLRPAAAADVLISAACNYSGVVMKHVFSQRRHRRIAHTRMLCMWLIYTLAHWSEVEIGDYFDRDASTVHHAVKRVDEVLKTDAELRQFVEQVKLARTQPPASIERGGVDEPKRLTHVVGQLPGMDAPANDDAKRDA